MLDELSRAVFVGTTDSVSKENSSGLSVVLVIVMRLEQIVKVLMCNRMPEK